MKGQLELDGCRGKPSKASRSNYRGAEHPEDASEICGLRRSRSKIAMAVRENQTEEDRPRKWVNTQFPAQETNQPVVPVQVSTWNQLPSSCHFQVLNRLSVEI